MNNIYISGEYLKKNPSYHVEDSPWKAQQILKMLSKHKLHVSTVAEVGCGAGEILRQLQFFLPEYVNFYGFEISPQAFSLCKLRENDRLHFYCGDLFVLDERPFDLLLCMDVVEHVEDYLGFLRKLWDKAAYKIFHIPLDVSVQSVLRCKPILRSRIQIGHLHYFTKETALLTLQDTGYEVIDWFYTSVSIDLPKGIKAKLIKPLRMVSFRIFPDITVRVLGGYSLLVLAK